jgi:transposase
VFHPKYRNDDTGRLAYDPAILLKIILYAYSKGITSSREIQWCCEINIIFKALSCDTVPHFTTLAKFVSQHADEIGELFEQILLVCHEQGLLRKDLAAYSASEKVIWPMVAANPMRLAMALLSLILESYSEVP